MIARGSCLPPQSWPTGGQVSAGHPCLMCPVLRAPSLWPPCSRSGQVATLGHGKLPVCVRATSARLGSLPGTPSAMGPFRVFPASPDVTCPGSLETQASRHWRVQWARTLTGWHAQHVGLASRLPRLATPALFSGLWVPALLHTRPGLPGFVSCPNSACLEPAWRGLGA